MAHDPIVLPAKDTDDTLLGHDARTLIDVLRETKEVQNWSELSLLIGISEATYGQIVKQCSTVQEQQRAIITSWLSTGKASWAVLVSGLRDELVGKAAVGDRIAQKYPAKKAISEDNKCDEEKLKEELSEAFQKRIDSYMLHLQSRTVKLLEALKGTEPALKPITPLAHPINVAVYNQNIFIVESGKNTVKILDGEGKEVRSLDGGRNEKEKFSYPKGVAILDDDHILVSDDHRLQKLTMDGVCVKSIGGGEKGNGDLQFGSPMAVAVHAKKVFVADSENDRVQVFDDELNFFDTIPLGNNGEPRGIAFDSEGFLYVSNWGAHCVVKIDTTGKCVLEFGVKGYSLGDLNRPNFLTIAKDLVFVSEWGNSRISIFDKQGEFLYCFGERGNGEDQFNTPFGLAIDEQGVLYVADHGNNRVTRHLNILKALL